MKFDVDPLYSSEIATFVEAAREGKLLYKQCSDCGRKHFYPRAHCPHCGSRNTSWEVSSGRGRIYSLTRTQRGRGPVVAPAVIDLQEGLRLTSVVCDADIASLQINDEVTVRFGEGRGGVPVVAFTTPQATEARAYSERALVASQLPDGNRLNATPPVLEQAAVIGGGRMGVGITLALLSAGLLVQLIDQGEDALRQAQNAIEAELDREISKGRATPAHKAEKMSRLRMGTDIAAVAQADVVIEAVWEQLALKKQVFALIDQHAKPGAILGTNTSTFDLDVIADATRRPEAVVGLHFFSPAHVMRLLEVVRGRRTGAVALAAATELAARMKKVAVVVGVCHGFVGNRLMIARETQANRLLIEGSLPQQVDSVLTDFGLPMGTFELQDMTGGIEVNFRRRQETGEKNWLIDRLVELGRTGRRVGKGYYRYMPGKGGPQVDPEMTALLDEASRQAGVQRRSIDRVEVLERLVYPMINEGARLIQEGIVERASDIDVVWQYGFGWPDWRGGPMYYADRVGVAHIEKRLRELSELHGPAFSPAPLLTQLARDGGLFTSL